MTRMKDSGIEWIGEVPEEWGITKSKYFLDTNKGLTITKENLIEDGIPVINYGQIHSKYGRSVSTVRDELPQVSTNYLKFKQSLLNKGDFVFADTSEDIEGSGNFSTRIDDNGELFAGYHTIKAKLKNALEHDFRYFMHYFDSMAFRKQVQNKVSGIKVYSVTQSILQETCLLLPSFIEQQRIADFLDKKVAQLDKVNSLLEEQIKTLEDYRKSLIYQTVTKGLDKTVPLKDSGVDWIGQIPEGWGITKFKYFLDTNKGLTITKENLIEDGIPVINYGQIHSKYGKSVNTDRDELPQVSANYLKFKQSLLKPGDFVFADTSEDIDGSGNFSTRIDDNGELFAGYHTIKAKLKNALEHDFRYFMHYFDSLAFRKQVQNKVSGIKVYSITQSILHETCLILPSLYEQQQIATFLDKKTKQINQMIAIKKEQIENINKQRQTLIYDYVTGKRRV